MENKNSQSGITLEWHSILTDVIRNGYLMILAALIAWMGIYVASHSVYSPAYTSSCTLAVRSKVVASGTYANLDLTSEMAGIYVNVFTQPSMKKMAAENLGLSSFDGTVKAKVLGETNLIDLSVTAHDPESAFRLLRSILAVYPNISDAVFTNSVIDVLTTPEMPMGPSNYITASRKNQLTVLAVIFEGALIVLFSVLRNTVKTEKNFHDQVDAKLIGTVEHERSHLSRRDMMRKKKRGRLINDAFSGLKFCEDYHKIAAKMEYLQKSQQSKTFVVTSVAENEGKSTSAVNLAIALSQRGYHVALLDMDTRKPAIYKLVGNRQKLTTELSDVLSGKAPFQDLEMFRYRKTGLLVAFNKTPHVNTSAWLDGMITRRLLSSMKKKMDFIIMDTAPVSVSTDAVNLTTIADQTLLVVRRDWVMVEDINDAILNINNAGGRLAGCILNDTCKPFAFFGQMGRNEEGSYDDRYDYRKKNPQHSYGKLTPDTPMSQDSSSAERWEADDRNQNGGTL